MPETYPQDIDGFDARMGWTGWPEWPYDHDVTAKQRLAATPVCAQSVTREWLVQTILTPHGDWSKGYPVGNHEAACLIERHWREWLIPTGYRVTCNAEGKAVVQIWDTESHEWLMVAIYDSYHAAQAAAIDAVMKEER